MSDRICLDCPAPISTKSSGRCRRCAPKVRAADPVARRNLSAAMLRAYQDPTKRAGAVERMLKAANEWRASEDGKARLPTLTRKAQEVRVRRQLGWCPADKLERYHSLRKSRRMKAAEARALIESEMTPFERQLQKVRQGAGLIEKPRLTRSYDYSLIGNATGMIA